jgi:hypothetical protein
LDIVKRNEIIDAKITVGLLLYKEFGRSL